MKIQKALGKEGSGFSKYKELVIGSTSLWFLIKFELIILFFGSIPGALGILLRKWTYPLILGKVGKGVIFGHHITFRHPQKIKIGDGTLIDDFCLLDAKGSHNRGVEIGQGVYVGRHSLIYCKGGDLFLEDRVNVGHRSLIFSSNELRIGSGTMLAADCYLMSGGNYDYGSDVKFADQSGTISKGPLLIGRNCWLGAKVVVLDGASIGEGTVVGAGAVVTEPLPLKVVAVGVPAKILKKI